MQKTIISLIFFILSSISYASYADDTETLPVVDIVVKSIPLSVEYADTYSTRNRGLMYRKSLCDKCGMLFNFKQQRMAGMWMKNTFIPLDVAFITAKGEITDIHAMQPHDLNVSASSEPVQFALEMNQGWFAKHDVKVGDRVTGITP